MARRLRVSPRTLRHYESLGVLRPGQVDPITGYRGYGHTELLRGVRIEQLKAAGLSLSDIRRALDDDETLPAILDRKRNELQESVNEGRRQLQILDALASGEQALAGMELTIAPALDVLAVRASTTQETMAATIRTQIQRLRRRLKLTEPDGTWTFAAQFPLDLHDGRDIEVAVAAVLSAPARDSTIWPSCRVLHTTFVGPTTLLPLAYDAVLTAAVERDVRPIGTVRETYRALGAVGTTVVAIPVRPKHWVPAAGPTAAAPVVGPAR